MDVVTLTDLLDLPVEITISDAAKRAFRPNSRFTLAIIITTQGKRALTWSRDHPLPNIFGLSDDRAAPRGVGPMELVARRQPSEGADFPKWSDCIDRLLDRLWSRTQQRPMKSVLWKAS